MRDGGPLAGGRGSFHGSSYCRAKIGHSPELATIKQCAYLARAVEYMTSALHDDTDPPRQRLMLATPWPELPDQPWDGGPNLPGDALARRRALCRAPCREFIRVVQVTRNTMIELVRFLQFKLVLCTAFRGVPRATASRRFECQFKSIDYEFRIACGHHKSKSSPTQHQLFTSTTTSLCQSCPATATDKSLITPP